MPTAPEALKRAEAELHRSTLEASGGNVSAAARQLGLTRAKLEYRLKKIGLLT
jgi:DNA-binding NtrC family response regulator